MATVSPIEMTCHVTSDVPSMEHGMELLQVAVESLVTLRKTYDLQGSIMADDGNPVESAETALLCLIGRVANALSMSLMFEVEDFSDPERYSKCPPSSSQADEIPVE